MDVAALDAAAGEEGRVAIRPMVAAGVFADAGLRPNSPIQTINVVSRRPRSFKSWSKVGSVWSVIGKR